ncbi:MAG: SLC13 family permease [Xanthomonadales bacterium]|nr:SLC13 family permease [Xanthomonadales bacterium]MBP6077590.1 SLC13 family permease [Xanthomonadales bacterium]
MTPEAWITLALLALAVLLFVSEKLPVDVVGIGVLSVLLLAGIVSPAEGFAGFSGSATLTVAAMFVLSAGLSETGVLERAARLLSRSGEWPWLLLLVMMLLVGAISAFMNNTAAVAIFLPLVLASARLRKIAPSKLLIPLSYAAQFGGVCTLIGTSTNILVSQIAETQGARAFTMFELGQVGLPLTLAGIVFVVLFERWLLPNHPDRSLGDSYGIGDYVTDLRVRASSPLIDLTLRESRFAEDNGVTVIELLRDRRRLWSRRADAIRAGDVIRVAAPLDKLNALRAQPGLEIDAEFQMSAGERPNDGVMLEVLIAPHSRLHGRPLSALVTELGSGALVVAVRHRDQVARGAALDQMLLASGDALLMLVDDTGLETIRARPEFIVLKEWQTRKSSRLRALWSLTIMVAVVTLAALEWVPIQVGALAGAALMVATRCLTREQAYRSIEWPVIILLAALIPLGTAMEKHGLASGAAQIVMQMIGEHGPLAALAAVYLATAVLTEFMSNNAAAVLLAPIAISTAQALGVDPMPFLIAVTVAASTAFATPVGYQTNTMVYQAGNYRFADFARIGIPLNVLFFMLSLWLIPRYWPF